MISHNRLLANGDRPVVWLPRNYRGDTGKPGVVFLNGTGTSWNAVYYREILLNIAEALTDAGYPLITTDAGIDEFGNQRARDGVDAAVAYAQSTQVGVRAGRFHGWGFSQGGGTILSYAGNNPTKMLSVGGVCPLVDLNILAEAGGQSKTFLDAAFPPAYNQATMGAANNPQTMAAAGKYAGIPVTVCGSSNDGVVPPARVQTFRDTVGGNAKYVNLGAVGHDNSVPNLPAAVSALLDNIRA